MLFVLPEVGSLLSSSDARIFIRTPEPDKESGSIKYSAGCVARSVEEKMSISKIQAELGAALVGAKVDPVTINRAGRVIAAVAAGRYPLPVEVDSYPLPARGAIASAIGAAQSLWENTPQARRQAVQRELKRFNREAQASWAHAPKAFANLRLLAKPAPVRTAPAAAKAVSVTRCPPGPKPEPVAFAGLRASYEERALARAADMAMRSVVEEALSAPSWI